MKSSIKNSLTRINKLFKDVKERISIEENGTLVIFSDTFWDLYSLKNFIASIAIMLILPLFTIITNISGVNFDTIPITQAAMIINVRIIYFLYFWTLGIAYISIIGASGASLISEEVHSGSILILISRPIKRIEIFLGKYLGLFVYSTILSFTSIFITGWMNILRYSQNIDHFLAILPFLGSTFLYSLLVNFLFVSITLAFSSIFKKSRNAAILTIFIAVFSFLGLMFIKLFIGDLYADFQIFHLDIGYHLANVYVYFIELLNAIPPAQVWQANFAATTGVFKLSQDVDRDQNIYTGGLDKTNYYLPQFSLLVWLGIAIGLMIFGIWKLKTRDFSL